MLCAVLPPILFFTNSKVSYFPGACNKTTTFCIFELTTDHNGDEKITTAVTEVEMIDGCRRGESPAQGELYRRYGSLMYAICRRYAPDQATAEDMMHDGFVTIYTKIGDFRSEGSFEGWCRRIFVNTALGHLRRAKQMNHPEQIDSAVKLSSTEASAIDRIAADDLTECIRSLPDGYRTILNLYAIEGYSHQEVAEMMGISENTSRSQYSRARVRLMEMLRERGIME